MSLLSKIKDLFWVSVGLLKLPFTTFPEIYSTALEVLETFISKGQDGIMKLEDFGDDPISVAFPGVLQTVMPSLFNGPLHIQHRSFTILIMSWMSLRDKLTDPHKTGIFYTHIYTCLWIITRCSNLKETHVSDNKIEALDVLSIVRKFKDLVANYKPDAFGKVKNFILGKESGGSIAEILDSIIESVEKKVSVPVIDDRIDRLLISVYRWHLPDYICNLTDFLAAGFNLKPEFRPAIVQMIVSLWKYSRKVDTSKKIRTNIEAFIQTLPFLCLEKEFEEILPPILSSASYAVSRDVDLTSREPALKFSKLVESHGSIQDTGDWLQQMGIQSTNKFFVWS